MIFARGKGFSELFQSSQIITRSCPRALPWAGICERLRRSFHIFDQIHDVCGQQVNPQIILAGTDRIGIDAVGVALLRYYGTTREVTKGKIFEQEQIARAVELGLGITRPDQIELVTSDSDSADFAKKIQALLN